MRLISQIASAAIVIGSVGNTQTLDLLTAYRQAADSSPVVGRARAQWQAEKYGKNIARSTLAPQLTAEGAINQSDLDLEGFGSSPINENYNPFSYSVTLTQPLINGSAWSALKAADSKAQSTEAALLAAQQDLILQTADAYFAILRAQAQKRTEQSQQILLKKIRDRAESEQRTGAGDIIAVEEANARLNGSQARLLSASNTVELARFALERLTHQPVEELVDLKQLDPQGPIPNQMADWVQSALDSQPILDQARKQIDAGRYLVSAAGRARWPMLALNAQYNRADGSLAPDINREESFVGISVAWPLFQGGKIRAEKAQAAALVQADQYGLEALQDRVRLETQQAFLNLQNSVAQYHAAKRALDSAATALNATRKGYEIGSRSVVELLDSSQRHAAAESGYEFALYNQLLARLQLKAAAGVLAEKDIETINQLLTNRTEHSHEP